ncbi:MAG: hypothetical protein ACXVBZ_10965 [Flavisolibacter sp.]
MKKQSFSTLVKRSVLSLGLSTILLAGAASAQSSTNPDPAVKYIGSIDGQPMFKVQLNNQTGDVYHLTIKDDEGTVLYAERFNDKQFSKSFKFDNADRSNVKLTFILEGNKTVQSKEFKVNSSTQVLDNVVVTTL